MDTAKKLVGERKAALTTSGTPVVVGNTEKKEDKPPKEEKKEEKPAEDKGMPKPPLPDKPKKAL